MSALRSDENVPTRRARVVTLGGGHGQGTLVAALGRLDVDVIAMPGVADDGGCSGKLRTIGVPPPGDIRRCLASLAADRRLAARLEERLSVGEDVDRSVGNLVIAHLFLELGDLQHAVDHVASALGCRGRVVPVAKTPGTLRVYDRDFGPMSGESRIESHAESPIAVIVEGPEHANPEAMEAILAADLVFFGPGSFVGSTLAAITTCDIAEALAETKARRVFVENLFPEPNLDYATHEVERILRDHLVIRSGGELVAFDVLRNGAAVSATTREDGTSMLEAPVSRDGRTHDVELFASALASHFTLRRADDALVPSDAGRMDRWIDAAFRRFL